MSQQTHITVICDYEGCQEERVFGVMTDDAPILTGGWVRWRFASRVGGAYKAVFTIDLCPGHSTSAPDQLVRSNTRDSKIEHFVPTKVEPTNA